MIKDLDIRLENIAERSIDTISTFQKYEGILTKSERTDVAARVNKLLSIRKLGALIRATRTRIDSCLIDWMDDEVQKRSLERPVDPRRYKAAEDIRDALNDLHVALDGITPSTDLKDVFQDQIRRQLIALVKTMTTEQRSEPEPETDHVADDTSATAELDPHRPQHHGDHDERTVPTRRSKAIDQKPRGRYPNRRKKDPYRRPHSARMH